MSFAAPDLLWLLLLPLALFCWEITHRRRAAAGSRPKILRAEAGPRSLQLSSINPQQSTAAKPRVWLCLGLMLAITALARPQWGRIEEPVFDQSREILLAVDLSRSMLTPDVKPSRLERAKLLIQSLLERLVGERVGLVVFAGTSFLQSPLSADYEILREFLPALGPDFLPEGGSNYGAMLETALQAFSATSSADRFLIVLSDGEATDDNWKMRIDELKKKNIRVLGLGIGTSGGGMIPDGSGGFAKDERGAVVLSKLESGTLQELARATGGVYRDASAWVDLAALVTETIDAGRKGQFVEKNTVRLVERFQWPLALGLWCLFVSFCYEFPVRPRPRDMRLTPSGNRKPEAAKAAAAAVLLVVLAGLSYPASGFAAATLAQPPPAPPGSADDSSARAGSPPELSTLGKIVGRLAQADTRSARDWAELGRETATWGSRLQSDQQPVPEGPVRDALAAVDIGSKMDAKVTDWPKLKEDLEALLKKPDEQEQEKNQQDQKDQKQNEQNQDQKKQDQKSDQQKNDKSGQPKSSPQDQKDSSQKQDPAEKQDTPPPEQKPGESAFGDMNKKEEPPPPPESTQKVGGAQEKKGDEPKAPADPALALPLQKLDQLRNQDSPAQLFQLMDGERKPAKKTGKDW
jgi:Ca-activated chloride channel homolog